jgi:hypothetical protein
MKVKVFQSRLEFVSAYVVLILWCAGLMAALFSPTDVLDKSKALKIFVDAVLSWINPRGNLGSRSNFPQITQLYYALVAWAIPFFVVIFNSWMQTRVGRDRGGLLFRKNLAMPCKLFVVLLLPIWVALIYFASLNHGGDTRLFLLGSSRLALGVFGVLISLGVGALFALICFSVRRVFFEKGGVYE